MTQDKTEIEKKIERRAEQIYGDDGFSIVPETDRIHKGIFIKGAQYGVGLSEAKVQELEKELSALKEQNRWIPVSDPPVLNGKYLVYCENEQFEATYENGKWTRGFGWIYSVESWTGLLPTPQKPEEV
jgi:hypothetical protein